MFKLIDNFLNKITMYRLVLYCLIFLVLAAFCFCFLNFLPYNPVDFLFSVAFLVLICLLANAVFAAVFEAPSNIESVYITALILALIIPPLHSFGSLPFVIWVGILAMASKYILAVNKKHILNPAAIAVALTAFALNQSATWWIGNIYMAPFVLITGILVTRKTRKADLVISFLGAASITVLGFNFLMGKDLLKTVQTLLFYTPMFFFAFIMLTEPMTMPPNRFLRIIYGLLTGFLFAPFIHIGTVYSTPELSLLAGNIFSYIVSPKEKLILELKEKIKISPDIYDFIFKPNQKLKFLAGQYMEWTLAHAHNDSRGMRRYFTIASSPENQNLRLGIKFYDNSSSFKKSLLSLELGDKIVASQLAGDFVLPKDKNKKMIFIAGGIGVTPFRSMAEHLLDKNEKRDAVLFYSNKGYADIVYKEFFDNAQEKTGIKTVYTLTDANLIPADWSGEKGFVSEEMIKKWASDYKKRTFYISGPKAMIDAFTKTLNKMGIDKSQIKTDFFPGFA